MLEFISEYGLWAIGALLFCDDLGVPLPSSTVVFTAALIAQNTGQIPILGLLIVAIICPVMGNTLLFLVGRHKGEEFLTNHGHRFYLTPKRRAKAENFINKHGDKAIFFMGMWATVRVFGSVIAGSMKMNPLKFMIFHASGVTVWANVIIWSGYFLGDNIGLFFREIWGKVF